MDREFWLERWRLNQIGFHQNEFNARLLRHWPTLGVPDGARVFVPLCGKSRAMLWLAQRGHPVVGVELSAEAAEAFFSEAGAPFERRQDGAFQRYDGEHVEIFCGDFFELTRDHLRGVAGVFDRGALVALPPDMRRKYAAHLLDILPVRSRILLLTLEYDQSLVPGPPFSVPGDEVQALFGARCSIELLERTTGEPVPPRFQERGVRGAVESSYRIVTER